MANGMRKLLKYMKEHPPKNVELQRINVLESENARLREALRVLGKLAEEVIEDNKNSTEGSVYQVCPEHIVKVATTALSGPNLQLGCLPTLQASRE